MDIYKLFDALKIIYAERGIELNVTIQKKKEEENEEKEADQ